MADEQEQWAIIDLFGHQRLAGRLSEHGLGGTSFVRVDVPSCGDTPEFTRLLGNGAIYSISFVSEDIARKVAGYVQARPVQPYEMMQIAERAGGRTLPGLLGDDRGNVVDSLVERRAGRRGFRYPRECVENELFNGGHGYTPGLSSGSLSLRPPSWCNSLHRAFIAAICS